MEWLVNMPLISFIEQHFFLAEVECRVNNGLVKSPCKGFYFSLFLKKDSILLRKDHSNTAQSQYL